MTLSIAQRGVWEHSPWFCCFAFGVGAVRCLRSCPQMWHLLAVPRGFNPALVPSLPSVKLCLTGQAHPSHADPKPSLSLVHCCFYFLCWCHTDFQVSRCDFHRPWKHDLQGFLLSKEQIRIQSAFKSITLEIQVALWTSATKSWLFMLLIACEWHYFNLWLAKEGLLMQMFMATLAFCLSQRV